MNATEERTVEVPTIKGSGASVRLPVPPRLALLGGGASAPPGHGVFRVLTRKDGDKRVVWDRTDLAQIQEAKELFDRLVLEGLVPYRVGLDGRATAEVMDEFDPGAEEILFLPVAAAVTGG